MKPYLSATIKLRLKAMTKVEPFLAAVYEPILRTVEEESALASVISKASSRWRRQSSAEDSDKGERLYPKRVRFLVNPAWLWGC